MPIILLILKAAVPALVRIGYETVTRKIPAGERGKTLKERMEIKMGVDL